MQETAQNLESNLGPTDTAWQRSGVLPARAVQSADLLKGQKSVVIQHNGASYRLHATKLGKLILTK